MYYIYILLSKKDNQFYTGYTNDLKDRLRLHNAGKVLSTKNRLPIVLVYYEACLNQQDATHREKYLKTAWGKRYIKQRLKNYLTGQTDAWNYFPHKALGGISPAEQNLEHSNKTKK